MLTATCHCKAVMIELSAKPETLTRCTCSICRRYGALWAYFTRSTAVVHADPDAVKAYLWNDRLIEFYHCRTCGCLTHYEGIEKTDDDRIAVNARMLEPGEIEHIHIRTFDGADSWEYLDE